MGDAYFYGGLKGAKGGEKGGAAEKHGREFSSPKKVKVSRINTVENGVDARAAADPGEFVVFAPTPFVPPGHCRKPLSVKV